MSLENQKINNLHNDKEYYIKTIDMLLNDYSDEIPEELISGKDEIKSFKIRTNWFNAVFNLLDNKKFPDSFRLKLHEFLVVYKKRRDNDNDDTRTTKEEIETANNLLLEAMEYIKN